MRSAAGGPALQRAALTCSIILSVIMQGVDTTIANVALPHSAEATVNPAIEARKTYLTPKRPASEPDSGIVIAAVTM